MNLDGVKRQRVILPALTSDAMAVYKRKLLKERKVAGIQSIRHNCMRDSLLKIFVENTICSVVLLAFKQ